MTDRIAIDVALLPPASLEPQLRTLNGRLLAPPEGFRFDATHLPHLTLAQQFVDAGALEAVLRAIETLTGSTHSLTLRAGEVHRGRSSSTWQVDRTAALHRLHRHVMDAIVTWDLGAGSTEAFVTDGGEPPRAADLEWVTRFRHDAAYERFDPHVTFGIGHLETSPAPVTFGASRLAVCQLGRFCTCRRVLADWALTQPLPTP